MTEFEEFLSTGSEDFSFDPLDVDSLELDIADLRDQPGVTYPALLLNNVLFTDCLRLLKSLKKSSFREVPVWIELEDEKTFQESGTIQLDSDILLVLRHLQIGATVYYSENDWEVLDLEDPVVLERFI